VVTNPSKMFLYIDMTTRRHVPGFRLTHISYIVYTTHMVYVQRIHLFVDTQHVGRSVLSGCHYYLSSLSF
jgi:hypothetical protein